jgi:hypothetical protein
VQRHILLRSIGTTLAGSASSGCLGGLAGGGRAVVSSPTAADTFGDAEVMT